MRFGRVTLAEAEGALLAHSVQTARGKFKKGRHLSAADIEALRDAGVETVTVARLEPGDVHEDEAAARIAAAVRGEGIAPSAAFTGRVNLFAEAAGIALLDQDRLDRLNLVDEALTIATVPPYAAVEPRQMVATIKVIPFAAPAAAVDECVRLASEAGPLLRVAPFRAKRIALIQTRLPDTRAKVLDKTVEITRARVEALGSALVYEARCGHDEAEVAAAVAAARTAGCDILLIAGASAIVDRRDVLPAGVERAGGDLVHFGMPVDPGNLMLAGRIGEVPVVGLPGCARSPKLNGFDWVLQRLCADVPVTKRDIMLMGAGGLLTDIPSRPLPRAQATEAAASAPRAPRIAAIVLAGGQGRRMGANKMTADVNGRPMLARVLDAVAASAAEPVIVVSGHQQEKIRELVEGRPVTLVHNPDFAEGLSTSLKAGLRSLPKDVDGFIVCLGDMPMVSAAHIDRLVAAFNPVEGRAICVPTWQGKQGNPVLWARNFADEMLSLAGDVGARHLIGANAELVAEVAMPDAAVLTDIDTPEALARLAEPC